MQKFPQTCRRDFGVSYAPNFLIFVNEICILYLTDETNTCKMNLPLGYSVNSPQMKYFRRDLWV